MPVRDKIAAAIMILIWGLNFVVIKFGLQDSPPLLLGALRFTFVAFPAVFFVRKPKVPLRLLLLYGLTISFGQFAFLFTAIYVGMPTGLASLVLQTQAFVSLALVAFIFGDRLRSSNYIGLCLAFLGLALLMIASVGGQGVSVAGFILTLCAASSWATGNMITKKIGKVDVLGLVAWGALTPIIPFLIASAVIEGPSRIAESLTHLTFTSVASVAYLSFGASLIGYSVWGHLLASHAVWKIAPLTLLVPVVGLIAGWAILGERLSTTQLIGSIVVLGGLVVNVFGADIGELRRRAAERFAR